MISESGLQGEFKDSQDLSLKIKLNKIPSNTLELKRALSCSLVLFSFMSTRTRVHIVVEEGAARVGPLFTPRAFQELTQVLWLSGSHPYQVRHLPLQGFEFFKKDLIIQ